MSIVAFTFGSFGDIVSLIELTLRVRKALSDSTGSSEEYQALILELQGFSDLLSMTRATLHSLKATNRQIISESIHLQVLHHLDHAGRLLKGLHMRIERYQDRLREGGSRARMLESWRKIGWALFKNSELRAMKGHLEEVIGRINSLLSATHWYVWYLFVRNECVISDSIANFLCTARRDTLDRVENICREQQVTLLQVSRHLLSYLQHRAIRRPFA